MSTAAVQAAADLALRPATLDDAAFAADMWTAVRPDDPEDPIVVRYRWEHPWDDSAWDRWIVTTDGHSVGTVSVNHPSWDEMPERYARIGADLMPDVRTAPRLATLIGYGESHATGVGALRASIWAWQDDAVKGEAIRSRGFAEERRERFWELDLRANAERVELLADRSRARMREEGVRISTLAQDTDPERYRKVWRMSNEAQMDVPTTVPHTTGPFEAFAASLREPGLREDRIWIARVGDEIVGISMLAYPPVRGVVHTEWTGTARSVRGKGVATALKCYTVMQAMALGVDRVRTDNDSKNAPILHINETMGYRIHGEQIQHLKELAGG